MEIQTAVSGLLALGLKGGFPEEVPVAEGQLTRQREEVCFRERSACMARKTRRFESPVLHVLGFALSVCSLTVLPWATEDKALGEGQENGCQVYNIRELWDVKPGTLKAAG